MPAALAAFGFSGAFFIVAFVPQNYCLIDPVEHRLYHQLQFLWWRKREIIFRAGEILAFTTDGRRLITRYGAHWDYRLVAVGNDGFKEPLSNWRRGALEEWNAKAIELAGQFGCASAEAPPECKVEVEDKAGAATLKFVPLAAR